MHLHHISFTCANVVCMLMCILPFIRSVEVNVVAIVTLTTSKYSTKSNYYCSCNYTYSVAIAIVVMVAIVVVVIVRFIFVA